MVMKSSGTGLGCASNHWSLHFRWTNSLPEPGPSNKCLATEDFHWIWPNKGRGEAQPVEATRLEVRIAHRQHLPPFQVDQSDEIRKWNVDAHWTIGLGAVLLLRRRCCARSIHYIRSVNCGLDGQFSATASLRHPCLSSLECLLFVSLTFTSNWLWFSNLSSFQHF